MFSESAKSDRVVEWELFDQDEELHRYSDYLGGWLFVSFMPKCNSPAFLGFASFLNDIFPDISRRGHSVIGVVGEKPKKLRSVYELYSLNYDLLSDPTGLLAKGAGVWCEKQLCGKRFFGVMKSIIILSPEGKVFARCLEDSLEDQKNWVQQALLG